MRCGGAIRFWRAAGNSRSRDRVRSLVHLTGRTEEGVMEERDSGLGPTEHEQQTGTGTAEGEDAPLREEDVTREDALDDRVPEGDGLSD
jgi:hypothetical protein